MVTKREILWCFCFCLIVSTVVLGFLSITRPSDNKVGFSLGLVDLILAFTLIKVNYISNIFWNKVCLFGYFALGLIAISIAIVRSL